MFKNLKYILLICFILFFSACEKSSEDTTTADTQPKSSSANVSLDGSVPLGTVNIKLCIEESGLCLNEVSENGHFNFSSVTLGENKNVSLQLQQKGKIPYATSLNLSEGKNYFSLESLSKLTRLSYRTNDEDKLYIGINALGEAYISTAIEIASSYVHELNLKTLTSIPDELHIEIGIDKNSGSLNNSSNKLLSTQNLYLKIYNQDIGAITFKNQGKSSQASVMSFASSYVGECNGNSYFYLSETEDALLKDDAQNYIDINSNEEGIQVELYGYDNTQNKWISIGEGDYNPAQRELKTCANFDTASVTIAYPISYKKPQTLCVEGTYIDANGQSTPAEGLLISAKGNLFSSAHTNEKGKVVLNLWEDASLYVYDYSDLKSGSNSITFSPSLTNNECTYTATIEIQTSFNARADINIVDKDSENFEGEYVWLYDNTQESFQSARSDVNGSLSFDLELGKTYSLQSLSFEKTFTASNAVEVFNLEHKNISPNLFIYDDEDKTKLHVIGHDADLKALNISVLVDGEEIPFSSKEALGNSFHWIFEIKDSAVKAEVTLSDDSLSVKENYFLDFDAIIDYDLLLNFIDPNGKTIQSHNLYADIEYEINTLGDTNGVQSLEYFLDGNAIVGNNLRLEDLELHTLGLKAIYTNGTLEKEFSIKADSIYATPEILNPLNDSFARFSLEESYEISTQDPNGDTLKLQWKVDGEDISNLSTFHYTFSELGNHNLSVEVSNAYKSIRSDAIVNVQYAKPVIIEDLNTSSLDILASDDGMQKNFKVVVKDPYNGVLTYKWYVNKTMVSIEKEFDYTFDKVGTYDIFCEITNQHTTISSGVKRITYFYDLPIVDETNLGGYLPLTLKRESRLFVKASDPYGEELKYEWFVDSQLVSSVDELILTPEHLPYLRISLKISNKHNSKVISAYRYVRALAPIINRPKQYERIPAVINETRQLSIDATDPYGGELRYVWYSGRSGLIGEGKDIEHIFTTTDWNYIYCRVYNAYTSASTFAYVDFNYDKPLILKELEGISQASLDVKYNFEVNASDPYDGNLTYKWSVNNAIINSELNTSVLTEFTQEGANEIKVLITNDFGISATSSAEANITIPTPSFIQTPSSISLKEGDEASFEVLVEDFFNAPVLSWTLDSKEIGNESKLSYIFTKIGENNVTCTATNKYGKSAKTSVIVRVIPYLAPIVNTTNLVNMSLSRGESFSFSSDVSNPESGKLTYRWSVDGELQDNNTSRFSYEFLSEKIQKIKLEVLNTYKSTIQEIDVIKTYDAPVLNSGFSDLNIKVGEDYRFAMDVSNPEAGELTYEWFIDGVKNRETSNILTGSYNELIKVNIKCIVSNRFKSIENSAYLNVTYDKPVLATLLSDLIVKRGTTESFDVDATNPQSDELKYSWYINNIKVSSNKVFNYTFSKIEAFTLKCVVSNAFTSVETSALMQSFYAPPVITQGISSQSLRRDEIVNFDVIANDPQDDILTYEWFINGEKVSDGSSYSYTAEKDGFYNIWCKVTNLFESTFSRAAITVSDSDNEPIQVSTFPKSHVVLYEQNMSISLSAQAGEDGIVYLPANSGDLNIGVVFGKETIVDVDAFHHFFVQTQVLPRYSGNSYDYKGCPDSEHIYWTSKTSSTQTSWSSTSYNPYFTGDEFFAADENGNVNYRIERDELFAAAILKFDKNSDGLLQLGEIPTNSGNMNYVAQIYKNATHRAYTFKELVSRGDLTGTTSIVGSIDTSKKCNIQKDIYLSITPFEEGDIYQHNYLNSSSMGSISTALYTRNDDFVSMAMIFDSNDLGILILDKTFPDYTGEPPSYDYAREDLLQAESVKLLGLAPEDSWENTTVNYLYATSIFDKDELITSSLNFYQNNPEIRIFNENDVGTRYLSYELWRYDSLVPMLEMGNRLNEYEIYTTHNFLEIPSASTQMTEFLEPGIIVTRDTQKMDISQETLENIDVIEQSFSYESDYGSVFVKIRDFSPSASVDNFIVEGAYTNLSKLIPESVFSSEMFSSNLIELDVAFVSNTRTLMSITEASDSLHIGSKIQLKDNNTQETSVFTISWFSSSVNKTEFYVEENIDGNFTGALLSIIPSISQIETIELIDIKTGSKDELIETLQQGETYDKHGVKRTKKIITDDEFIHPNHVES